MSGPNSHGSPKETKALAVSAGKGFVWLLFAGGLGKIAGLSAHVGLGFLLLDEHWGIYSISLSVMVFVEFMRNGAVSHWLVAKGRDAYMGASGDAFWIATAFNVFSFIALSTLSPVIAGYYAEPSLTLLIIAGAFSFVLGTPASVLRAKLQVDLEFRKLSFLDAALSAVRAGVLIVAAAAGADALTFGYAFIVHSTMEAILCWLLTRDAPWLRKPSLNTWPNIFKDLWRLFAGNLFQKISERGDYFVLSFLISTSLLGQYFFAYQLVFQLSVLISVSFQTILFPIFNRLVHERERLKNAVERTVGALILTVTAPSFLLAVVAAPLESIIWNGKWSSAVEAIEVFAIAEPLRGLVVVAHCLLLAQARFVARIFLMLGICSTVVLGAFVGGVLFQDALGPIAIVAVIIQTLFVLTSTAILFRGIGCKILSIAYSIAIPIIIGIVSATASILLEKYLSSLDINELYSTFSIAIVFIIIFGVLTRLVRHRDLEFIMSIFPRGALRRVLCSLLFLK